MKNRFINQKDDSELFVNEINRLADDWLEKISQVNLQKYDEFLLKPGEHDGDNEDWILMQSMREVDTNTYIQIKGYK